MSHTSPVFDHVTLYVSDVEASRRFYSEALGAPTWDDEFVEWGDFSITRGGHVTQRLHVAFGVPDRGAVDAWWERLTAAGYRSDGEPGERPQYRDGYYGAFVLDPDANSVEAVHHPGSVDRGIDHLWLRTRDVAAVRDFYGALAPVVGLRVAHDSSERVRYTDGAGSFTFVAGPEPTRCVHLAFRAGDAETVDAFHRSALAAGAQSNGAPGERPRYHPGYYAAYVLDPDGHNVEAVFHKR